MSRTLDQHTFAEKTLTDKTFAGRRKWIALIGVLLVAVLGILLETVYYNRAALEYGEYEDTFALDGTDSRVKVENTSYTSPLDEETVENLKYQQELNKTFSELMGVEYVEQTDDSISVVDGVWYKTVQQAVITIRLDEPRYIRQLQFTYPVDQSKYSSYGIQTDLYLDGEKLNDGLIYDAVNAWLDTGYTTINRVADTLVLTTYGDFTFVGAGASVSVHSGFMLNPFRLFFFIGTGLLILFLLLAVDWYEKRLELVFGITGLWFGLCIAMFVGTNQMNWDEQVHFLKAYEAAYGSTIETTESALGMRGMYNPEYANLMEYTAVTKYLRDNDDVEHADLSYQTRFIGYSVRAYVPSALFIKIARILHVPFDVLYLMGKMGNLIFYLLALMLGIHTAKTGRKFIVLLGLMPTCLFLASSYSYDAFITSFLFLGFILWINEITSEEKMSWTTGLLMMACFVAGSWSKQIYIFMILLALFLPAKKFPDLKSHLIFKAMSIVLMGLVLMTIFSAPGAAKNLPIAAGLNYDLSTAGDIRVQGVSMIGQIRYILQNPLTYTVLLLKSIAGCLFAYTLGLEPWLALGFCGRYPAAFSMVTAVLILGTMLFREKDENVLSLKLWQRILLGVMFFGIVCVIWTSLYGTYCKVGDTSIQGVQARYYIPLMLPFMYIFANKKWTIQLRSAEFYRILFVAVSLLNAYGIYTLILKPMLF